MGKDVDGKIDAMMVDASPALRLANAISSGDVQEAMAVLYSGEVDISKGDPHDGGKTPLHKAAEAGNMLIVTLLVDRGASVMCTDRHGHTALELAIRHKHKEIAYMLGKKLHAVVDDLKESRGLLDHSLPSKVCTVC